MQVLTQTDEGFDNIAQTNTEWQKQRIFAGEECETSRLSICCILKHGFFRPLAQVNNLSLGFSGLYFDLNI